MNRLLGVGACQIEPKSGNIDHNLDALARQIDIMRGYSPWIKLICAPELVLQGPYRMETTAQPIPGPITQFCSDLARKHAIYLIPGSVYERDGETIYNTAPIFDPQGKIVTTYRKMYPWRPYEKTTSGNETVAFDIPGAGRVGVCICYDLWFPEVIRDLVWKGAEVIVVPTFTSTQDRSQEIVLCRAAAITNQCYLISINALGRGSKGQSLIVDPEGNILQQAGQLPENLMAMLNLDRVSQVRDYGTCGVSRSVASFIHESHCFPYQKERVRSPLTTTIAPLDATED